MRADEQWATIGRLVLADGDRFGAVEALVDGELRLDFAQLRDAVIDAARAHIAAGVAKGDRVAIWAPNIAEWVVSALGAVTAGAVLVPLNTRYKGVEAADIIDRSGASVLLCVNGFLGNDYVAMLQGLDLPSLRHIVVLRGDAPAGTISWDAYLAAGADVTVADVEARLASVGPGDLCDLVFTSGTTGKPKGVMVTHAQTLRVFEVWSEVVGLSEGDRYLIVNPFFHTFGYKAGIIACLLRGATMLPEPVFDVDRVLDRIEAERVSVLPGPPTLFLTILDSPDRATRDLSSLRVGVTGAAAIPVSMIEWMRDDLGFSTVITAYGLTEATGTVTMCRAEDDPETIALTSGRAIPDTEVRIVDEQGNEVACGEPGEIVCRGHNVMLGYLDDPAATAETIDAEGWLHTGDVGVMDERGYVRITDRTKDMFIVGGFNAYPAEIENLLMGKGDFAQVAVIGVPDERMGEVGMAFLVPRHDAGGARIDVDLDELRGWCRETMANFKVPRHFRVVDALPTNASGKVLKVELRAAAVDELTGN
ncbi:MAG: FadD3 family acyl-CoA ligase [Acidimicrobiia bacterium]